MKDIAKYQIIRLADRPELKDRAAQWFSEKWSISNETYLESIERHSDPLPVDRPYKFLRAVWLGVPLPGDGRW